MVHFGQRIAKERYAPWVDHYFDYDLLKRKLKAIQNASGQSQRDEAIQEFQHALDREIEKVGNRQSLQTLGGGKLHLAALVPANGQHPGLQHATSSIPDIVPAPFLQVLSFYKDKAGGARAAAESIQRTTKIAIDEASSYSTIPPEKVVRLPSRSGHHHTTEMPLSLYHFSA